MTMDKHYPAGPWYVYNARRGEFLVRAEKNRGRYKTVPVGARYCLWTARIGGAMVYKNPSSAKRWANRINAQLASRDCRAVNAETARCIIEIAVAPLPAAGATSPRWNPKDSRGAAADPLRVGGGA